MFDKDTTVSKYGLLAALDSLFAFEKEEPLTREEELAEINAAEQEPGFLGKLFDDEYGESFSDYLNRTGIDEAPEPEEDPYDDHNYHEEEDYSSYDSYDSNDSYDSYDYDQDF